jgi:exodeoxyribonuclease-3
MVRKEWFAGDPVYTHPSFDIESRIVQVERGDLVIASVYVPNGGKDYPAKLNFLTQLIDWARQLHVEGRSLLLCGDINIARTEMDVHPKERKPNAIGQLPEERALFETLLGTGLEDVGRVFEPDNAGLFTWWAPWRNMRARNIGWRLDYMLVSSTMMGTVTSCVVQADVGTSDHAPVVLTTSEGATHRAS